MHVYIYMYIHIHIVHKNCLIVLQYIFHIYKMEIIKSTFQDYQVSYDLLLFSCSVLSDSLQPHGL